MLYGRITKLIGLRVSYYSELNCGIKDGAGLVDEVAATCLTPKAN